MARLDHLFIIEEIDPDDPPLEIERGMNYRIICVICDRAIGAYQLSHTPPEGMIERHIVRMHLQDSRRRPSSSHSSAMSIDVEKDQ